MSIQKIILNSAINLYFVYVFIHMKLLSFYAF